MRRRHAVLALLAPFVIVLGVSPGARAQNGTVSMRIDPQTAICSADVSAGDSLRVWIVVELAGASADGIASASFSIVGLPAAWQVTLTPNAQATVALGDPFAASASIGFPTCQLGEGGIVVLYEARIVATTPESDVELRVCAAEPSPFGVAGPFLSGCGLDEWLAASGGRFGINVPAGFACTSAPSCQPVPVERSTWALMKRTYR